MTNKIKLCPSMIRADLTNLRKDIKILTEAGANVLVVGTSRIFTIHEDLKTVVQIVREKINSIQ